MQSEIPSIAHAKANPGKVTFASWQLGGLNHVYLEMLRSDTGADMLQRALQEHARCTTRSRRRRIYLMMAANATQVAWVRAGKLKALGMSSAESCESPAVPASPGIRSNGLRPVGL